MNRIDRLTGIILALQREQQTAARLAERFEVSRRTILRDVDALGQLGVPVISLPGAGGGFRLADGYWLPPLNFSAAEAAVVLLALDGLGNTSDSPFGAAQGAVVDKLRTALRPEVLSAAERRLATLAVAPPRPPPEPDQFRLLERAVMEERWLRIDYQSMRRIATHNLLPVRLQAVDGRWYCRAISLEAGEERSYRLDRMRDLVPIAAPADAEAARTAAARLRRAYDDPSHPEVVIRMTYQGVRLAEDKSHWEHHLREIRGDGWELRFRCPPAELAYHAREVFALGATAEVVSPAELRSMVRDLAAATVAVYDDSRKR